MSPRALSIAARIRILPGARPRSPLQYRQQRRDLVDIRRIDHLGEANAFETGTDHRFEVGLEPWRRARIHPHVATRTVRPASSAAAIMPRASAFSVGSTPSSISSRIASAFETSPWG